MSYGSSSKTSSVKLNIQMVLDAMDDLLGDYTPFAPDGVPSLSGCFVYCGQNVLRSDYLYIVPVELESQFPADAFQYITTGVLKGNAPHVRKVRCSFGELLNHCIAAFQKYRDFEHMLDQVISSGGSLTELCQAGSLYFQNPMYIHDNFFAVLAESGHMEGMLEFEYNEKTQRRYIPLSIINELKFDECYRQTLSLRKASIWTDDQNVRSLFVNLWAENDYLGRLMINEIGASLRPGHFRMAEMFAEYVLLWMRNLDLRQQHRNHDFQETLIELMTTGSADERDLHSLLAILDWKVSDYYLCMKLQNQNINNTVWSDIALNAHLMSTLKGCISFRYQHQLCIVINLTVAQLEEGGLRQLFAPIIRDGCMYAGISNPVHGLRNVYSGFLQADYSIDYIMNEDNSEWLVSFASCALSYIRECSCKCLTPQMVVHPVLLRLKEYDAQSGTQYYETLRVYLTCERSIPQTAAALIIHRTTLTYRLGKIAEITRINLEDPNLRLYLLLSFRLLEQGRGNVNNE